MINIFFLGQREDDYSFEMRDLFIKIFGFSMPSKYALDKICVFISASKTL